VGPEASSCTCTHPNGVHTHGDIFGGLLWRGGTVARWPRIRRGGGGVALGGREAGGDSGAAKSAPLGAWNRPVWRMSATAESGAWIGRAVIVNGACASALGLNSVCRVAPVGSSAKGARRVAFWRDVRRSNAQPHQFWAKLWVRLGVRVLEVLAALHALPVPANTCDSETTEGETITRAERAHGGRDEERALVPCRFPLR